MVISLADRRNPGCERRRGRVGQAVQARDDSQDQAKPPCKRWNARSTFGPEGEENSKCWGYTKHAPSYKAVAIHQAPPTRMILSWP
jgi:hypothetical protein